MPHSWIVKLPRKGSFKSSIRRTTKSKRNSSKKKPKREDDHTASTTVQQQQQSTTTQPQNVLQNVSQNIPQNLQQQSNQQSTQQSTVSNENINQTVVATNQQHSAVQQQQSTDTPGVDTSTTSTSSGSGSGHLSSATAFTYNTTTPNQLPITNLNDSPPIDLAFTNEQSNLQQQNQLITTNYANTSCPTSNCIHSMPMHHKSFAIKPIPNQTSRPLLVFINPKSGGNQGVKLMVSSFTNSKIRILESF